MVFLLILLVGAEHEPQPRNTAWKQQGRELLYHWHLDYGLLAPGNETAIVTEVAECRHSAKARNVVLLHARGALIRGKHVFHLGEACRLGIAEVGEVLACARQDRCREGRQWFLAWTPTGAGLLVNMPLNTRSLLYRRVAKTIALANPSEGVFSGRCKSRITNTERNAVFIQSRSVEVPTRGLHRYRHVDYCSLPYKSFLRKSDVERANALTHVYERARLTGNHMSGPEYVRHRCDVGQRLTANSRHASVHKWSELRQESSQPAAGGRRAVLGARTVLVLGRRLVAFTVCVRLAQAREDCGCLRAARANSAAVAMTKLSLRKRDVARRCSINSLQGGRKDMVFFRRECTGRDIVTYIPTVKFQCAVTVYDEKGFPIRPDLELSTKSLVYDEEGCPFPALMTEEELLISSIRIMNFEPSFQFMGPTSRSISERDARDILMRVHCPADDLAHLTLSIFRMINSSPTLLVHNPISQGTSDLQRGERYDNMDFDFYSAILLAVDASWRLSNISYDKVCTWRCECGCHNVQKGTDCVSDLSIAPPFEPSLISEDLGRRGTLVKTEEGWERKEAVETNILPKLVILPVLSNVGVTPQRGSASTISTVYSMEADCDSDSGTSEGNYSDTDMHTDSDSDCDMLVGGGSDRTISDIDRDYEADGQCDVCRIPLGPHVDCEARAFRCCDSVAQNCTWAEFNHCTLFNADSIQIMQEWQSNTRAWGERKKLNETEWAYELVKNCGACSKEIAPGKSPMPPDVVFPGTVQNLCTVSIRVIDAQLGQIWEDGWQESTLREEGFVYQLGHNGRACLSPEEPSRPLLLIGLEGSQTVQVKFCACGKYDGGRAGDWQQILDKGWFHSSLVHPGACATFKVFEDVEDFSRSPRNIDAGSASAPGSAPTNLTIQPPTENTGGITIWKQLKMCIETYALDRAFTSLLPAVHEAQRPLIGAVWETINPAIAQTGQGSFRSPPPFEAFCPDGISLCRAAHCARAARWSPSL
ncbi:hypothetical protein C8R43DRAFT_1211351 [Mycena crocata]|nr:hypothetical protein C8R43DRAFT_1211351 [Mycena crocata]